jgi:hypothetical protein
LSNAANLTTATANSHVGHYAITASGAVDADYTISYDAGSLAVTPAPLTVTADSKTKVYGDSLPGLTACYSGFVNGDSASVLIGTPALTTDAALHSAPGVYTITAGPGTLADPDYVFQFANGTLTVNKASTARSWPSRPPPYWPGSIRCRLRPP